MRKNSPQHQTPKVPEKASSPRLTLRFQPIRPKDDRHGESSKSSSVSSSDPRYQSYCVTMETRDNAYDFVKCEMPMSSTRNCNSSGANDATDAQLNVVSSSKDDEVPDDAALSTTPRATTSQTSTTTTAEKVETFETDLRGAAHKTSMATSENNNHTDFDDVSDGEQVDGRRKRRRASKDSTDSKHGIASTRNNANNNNSKNAQTLNKKGTAGLSDSETESRHSDEMDMTASDSKTAEVTNNNGNNHTPIHRLSPKVPPLKIVIPTTSNLEPDKDRCRTNSAKQILPYIVTTSSDSCDTKSEASLIHEGGDKENNKEDSRGKDVPPGPEERYQRVTRSSQRMAAALASANASALHGQNVVDGNTYNVDTHKLSSGDGSSEEQGTSDIHPRKRKLRSRDAQSAAAAAAAAVAAAALASTSHQEELAVINSYEMYLNIKKQVDRRRQTMFVVQPKPPQGFKDYLMNRSSYVLAGNAASRLSVPMVIDIRIPPPQSLTGLMKDLFVSQEKERYKLRLQHIIEKEKLVLSVEQEILRVHGRAARALANQSTPLSVCTILKDEEIYNQIEPEQEEKERNARTRYNGRLFISWLQDVDDKWEKIKEAMLLRHHNEAESLHAVQKLDWEWKMKESGTCDTKSTPIIDDISVPMVHVNDDFDLLPA